MRKIMTFIMDKFAVLKVAANRKKIKMTTSHKGNITHAGHLTLEQHERKRMRCINRMTAGLFVACMAMSGMSITAFAAGSTQGVDTFNTVVQFIVDWVARIGLVIGFIGAVQFAMGFKDDSADGKTRGLMCLASGFIVFAVAKAYDMFAA